MQGAKLKAAYESEAELEQRVARLEAEGGDLRTKLLLQDFDLTNTKSLKMILHDKVEDLERVIAAHEDLVSASILLSSEAGQRR